MKDINQDKILEIRMACEKRLDEAYPAGVPAEVKNRFEKEISALAESNYIEHFAVYQLLASVAEAKGFPLYGRGTLMGSLLYFLLGHGRFNPMPAHYYCPHCGHYEFVQGHGYGVDLPEKTCPECGRKIWADGYDIPKESVGGIDGKKTIAFEFNIAKDFRPIAEKALREAYPDREIVVKGGFTYRGDDEEEHIVPVGFIILPQGMTVKDESVMEYLHGLENGEPCLLGNPNRMERKGMVSISLIDHEGLDQLYKLGWKHKVDLDLLGVQMFKKVGWRDIYDYVDLSEAAERLFMECKPQSFREMVNLEALSHATLADGETDEVEIPDACMELMRSDEFKRCPLYAREDVFDYLMDPDGEECERAYDAMEAFRKGWFSNPKRIEERTELLLPTDLECTASHFRYVFPRAHAVEYMMMYARLAWVKMLDKATDDVTTDIIASVVSDYFELDKEDVLSAKRSPEYVLPRQVIMYFCKEIMDASYEDIASLFDKQYQDEILEGCSIIEAFMAPSEKNIYKELEFMERRILGKCKRS
jgi:DNA polymerase-3 subunit alpha (Gram-positive type)